MTDQSETGTPELVVPVYIDVNLLLDLLASREDGFSLVEQVTSKTAETTQSETSLSGGFGVSGVLSLLKIDAGASRRKGAGEEKGAEVKTERFHTYGSLLNRLRLSLEDEGSVRHVGAVENDWPAIAPGDFVEVTGVFRPNPFTDALATTSRVLDIIELVSQIDAATPTQGRKSQGSPKAQQRHQASELSQMRKFFDGLAQDAEGQQVLVFLIETPLAAHTVVVFVFPEYLRDKTFTELLQGEFRVLGKAVRKIDWDSDERIELLRGSALGSLNEEMLTPLIGALQEMASAGMRLPEIVTEVNPPALQLIPIAIYV